MPSLKTSKDALAARITALKARHFELEAKLVREQARPAPDSVQLGRLKRRKLLIKDELARYEGVLRSLGRRLSAPVRKTGPAQ